MRRSGNGTPQQCVENLLRITRGEVPYDRLRGIGAKYIGQPSIIASPELTSDVDWMLRTYEPRITVRAVELVAKATEIGCFEIDVDIIIPAKEARNG